MLKIPSQGNAERLRATPDRVLPVFNQDTVAVPPEVRDMLVCELEFTGEEIDTEGIYWAPDTKRVIYEKRSYYGHLWGHVARKYPLLCKDNLPKALDYFSESGTLPVHFPARSRYTEDTRLILVEDIPSSIKVSRVAPAAALMGHYVSSDTAVGLHKLGFRDIVLALDPDVTVKALKTARRLSPIFDSVDVLRLDKDPKDMSDDELEVFCGT